jgi:hypothetical protein
VIQRHRARRPTLLVFYPFTRDFIPASFARLKEQLHASKSPSRRRSRCVTGDTQVEIAASRGTQRIARALQIAIYLAHVGFGLSSPILAKPSAATARLFATPASASRTRATIFLSIARSASLKARYGCTRNAYLRERRNEGAACESPRHRVRYRAPDREVVARACRARRLGTHDRHSAPRPPRRQRQA